MASLLCLTKNHHFCWNVNFGKGQVQSANHHAQTAQTAMPSVARTNATQRTHLLRMLQTRSYLSSPQMTWHWRGLSEIPKKMAMIKRKWWINCFGFWVVGVWHFETSKPHSTSSIRLWTLGTELFNATQLYDYAFVISSCSKMWFGYSNTRQKTVHTL